MDDAAPGAIETVDWPDDAEVAAALLALTLPTLRNPVDPCGLHTT